MAARWSFGLSSACIFCEIANCCIETHLIHCCPHINTNEGIYSIHIYVSLKFLNIFVQICDHNKYIIRYMCPNKKMSEESLVGDKINGFDFFCFSPNFSYICTCTDILILSISYLGKHSVLFGLYYPSLQFNRFKAFLTSDKLRAKTFLEPKKLCLAMSFLQWYIWLYKKQMHAHTNLYSRAYFAAAR